MTLRSLPALDGALAAKADGTPSQKVMAHWNADVRAAEEPDSSISILGVIGEDVWGDGVSAKRVAAALRYIGDRDITVNINSPGGNFIEGIAIYNMLRQHPRQVTIKVLGIAASAAAIIAMAGDQIEVAKAGFLMIHNTHVVVYGDRNVHRDIADKLEAFDGTVARLFADRSGLKQAAVAAMMDDETYFDGPAAIAAGFADALLPDDAVKQEKVANVSALRRVDSALNKQGWSRTEIRAVLKELTGKPSAAGDDTPSAVDAVAIDSTPLSLALVRLRLAKA